MRNKVQERSWIRAFAEMTVNPQTTTSKPMPKWDVHFRLRRQFRCQEPPTTLTVIVSEAKNLMFSREINLPIGKNSRFCTEFTLNAAEGFRITVFRLRTFYHGLCSFGFGSKHRNRVHWRPRGVVQP